MGSHLKPSSQIRENFSLPDMSSEYVDQWMTWSKIEMGASENGTEEQETYKEMAISNKNCPNKDMINYIKTCWNVYSNNESCCLYKSEQ